MEMCSRMQLNVSENLVSSIERKLLIVICSGFSRERNFGKVFSFCTMDANICTWCFPFLLCVI
jgi:hypothetical protein